MPTQNQQIYKPHNNFHLTHPLFTTYLRPYYQLSRIFSVAFKSLPSSITCARTTATRQLPPCTLQETHPFLRVCLGRSETKSTATCSPPLITCSLNRDEPSDISSATATYLVTPCRQSSLFATDRTMALRKPPHPSLRISI